MKSYLTKIIWMLKRKMEIPQKMKQKQMHMMPKIPTREENPITVKRQRKPPAWHKDYFDNSTNRIDKEEWNTAVMTELDASKKELNLDRGPFFQVGIHNQEGP
ncbi:hypothetical protein WA026_009200 [Henosepilachna vigintioctopunctata]|uniref:Uncharacterized protein n=1 Tax=Henosepilachna vigintioctopunctata TaxID=420089 RepID=A0AAW1UR03_9CUCU